MKDYSIYLIDLEKAIKKYRKHRLKDEIDLAGLTACKIVTLGIMLNELTETEHSKWLQKQNAKNTNQ